ncbi:hypothetical protein DFP72DRAFT_941100 [Ephemerocybe angulata]|uniref:Uncharacterized protein n=1 Tax=Ephemerocybe angulata TaxID=980116 RepID=A0A8H6LV44_9AGAR|nr:hypothetical protein DFP72DRAFT_941100 [Tulosesus angulatus]
MAHIPDDAPLFRFQDLPEDLARLVFEAAAHDVDKPNWSCALVSTTVRSWVEPILYRRIVIDTPWKMTLLGQTMSHHPAKAPAFFSTHVEQIYIIIRRDRLNPSYSDLYSLELLSACPNITLLDFDHRTEGGEKPSLKIGQHAAWRAMRPKRLYIRDEMFMPSHRHFRVDENPIFTALTHLELKWDVIRNGAVTTWAWDTLSRLTTLTHLCISVQPMTDTLVRRIGAVHLHTATSYFPPSLILCVFSVSFWPWALENARIIVTSNGETLDRRVVVAVNRSYYFQELERGDDGLWVNQTIWRWSNGSQEARKDDVENFWKRAEDKVATRSSERPLVL